MSFRFRVSDLKLKIRIFRDFKLVLREVCSGGVVCKWWLMVSDWIQAFLIPAYRWFEDRLRRNDELFRISCSPGRKPRDEIKMLWVIEIKERCWQRTISSPYCFRSWRQRLSYFAKSPPASDKWVQDKFLNCADTHYSSAVFGIFSDLWLSGDSTVRCRYHNYFNPVRACSHGMHSFYKISSIWKLIQRVSIHHAQVLFCRSPVSSVWLLCFTWHLMSQQERWELH